MRPVSLTLVLLLVTGVVMLAGCENVLKLDRGTEIQIGQQGAADLERQHGTVNDPAGLARLNTIGKRLAAASEEPGLPWTFKILNQKEVNAVALPGGFVYVTQGLMQYATDDDVLAGVVGHEITHAAHHHGKEAVEEAMQQGLLVGLITQKSAASIQQAAQIALDLELRQGYREKEYEADEYGTSYALKAGFDAAGLLRLLKYLHTKEGDPSRITWLLQSHPPLSKRIQHLEDFIPQLTGRPLPADMGPAR